MKLDQERSHQQVYSHLQRGWCSVSLDISSHFLKRNCIFPDVKLLLFPSLRTVQLPVNVKTFVRRPHIVWYRCELIVCCKAWGHSRILDSSSSLFSAFLWLLTRVLRFLCSSLLLLRISHPFLFGYITFAYVGGRRMVLLVLIPLFVLLSSLVICSPSIFNLYLLSHWFF